MRISMITAREWARSRRTYRRAAQEWLDRQARATRASQ
jgi:hypothetical protein